MISTTAQKKRKKDSSKALSALLVTSVMLCACSRQFDHSPFPMKTSKPKMSINDHPTSYVKEPRDNLRRIRFNQIEDYMDSSNEIRIAAKDYTPEQLSEIRPLYDLLQTKTAYKFYVMCGIVHRRPFEHKDFDITKEQVRTSDGDSY